MTYYVNSSSYPYSSVVYIEATFSNGEVYTGSGVVVGQNDVLTASHVIYSISDGGLATSITVYPARDGASKPYGSYGADWVNYYPIDQDGDGLLTQSESEYDFALLGFDETIGTTTGWFGLDANAGDGYYYVTGYPGVYATSSGPRLTQDYGYQYETSYTTNWINYSLEINSGNSGGPIWHNINGLPYVVGVVSTASWSPNIDAYYNTIVGWINGNDTLLSSTATDVYYSGTSGADSISGTSGDDTVMGYSGGDTISGGDGNDLIYGNQGLDYIVGGAGNDVIYGGQNAGSYMTYGTGGTLAYREGTETISGGSGNDLIYANHGSDLVVGGSGRDTLYGGQDHDTIYGGDEVDYIYGNLGDDLIVGGDGWDRFYIQSNGGDDTISDFVRLNDWLYIEADLNNSGIDTDQEVIDAATQVGNDVVINFGNGHTVTLSNFAVSDLSTADIVIF